MSDTDDMPFPFPVAETVDYDIHDAALRESAEWEMSAELATLRADLLAAEVERLRKLAAKLRWRLRARNEVVQAAARLMVAADACDREAEREHPSSRSSAPAVRYINAMKRLREALERGGR